MGLFVVVFSVRSNDFLSICVAFAFKFPFTFHLRPTYVPFALHMRSVGSVVDGGFVKISKIYVAACLRKSSVRTSEKGIACGKNVTVSQILVRLDLGKYPVIHL